MGGEDLGTAGMSGSEPAGMRLGKRTLVHQPTLTT